jgi:phosphoglycolate phosphatase
MPIRGVIFDFDGTLADTLPDIAAAVNVGLRSFGLSERPNTEVKQWVGEGLPTLCARALAASGSDLPLAEFVAVVTESYRQNRLVLTAPFDGVAELLDALTARRIPLSILTNKPHEHTIPMADALFSKWPFVAIEGYRQEPRRKPDPRTAWEIVEQMGLDRSEVGFVGDSFTDMQTAVNAGLIAIGATWGYRSRQELIDAGARHLIDDPLQLLSLL